jgi:hypothetical protein
MAYDPYRNNSQWETYGREGSAASAWSLGILVLFVLGLLVFAANTRNTNVSMDKQPAWTGAETTGGPAILSPQWPAPPSQLE